MSTQIKAWDDERNKLLADCRKMTTDAGTENRDLTKEEDVRFDEMFNKASDLQKNIQREQALIEEEKRTLELDQSASEPVKEEPRNDQEPDGEKRTAGPFNERADAQFGWETDEYRSMFGKFLTDGSDVIPLDVKKQLSNTEEFRALQADRDIYGGHLVAPQQFMAELIQAKDNLTFMRQISRTFPVTNAQSLGGAFT